MERQRWMSVLFLPLAALLLSTPVQAGRLWCKTDPVVALDGHLADLTVAIPLHAVWRVTGPTSLVIGTPSGITRHVLVRDVGFNGNVTTIRFVDVGNSVNGCFPVTIKASIPLAAVVGDDATVPLRLTLTVDDIVLQTVTGTTELTRLRVTLCPGLLG